jgi:aryl-alcohol dehydrogenase-like predicted oxidoreductase
LEIILKKLIIGTAQLATNYGISNFEKKKTYKKIMCFLEFCFQNSLNSFDVAPGYTSEQIIGDFIKKNNIVNISVSTKIPSLSLVKSKKKLDFIKENIENSLEKLGLNKLENLFFHDENDLDFFIKNEWKINEIAKGFNVKNLGFSLYSRDTYNILNKNKYINSLQVPVNIINKDFDKIKSSKKLIGRSIFLQGLLINKKIKTKNKILKNFNLNLIKLANSKKIDLYSLCLNYSLKQIKNQKIIVGFDDLKQLKQILKFNKNYYGIDDDVKLIRSLVDKSYYNIIKDPRKW